MTTACDRFRAQLDAWLDDELDAADRAELESHVDSCDACRAYFGRAAAVADRLSELGTVADAIAASAGSIPERRPSYSQPIVRIAAAIVLLAVAGLAWRAGLWRSERTASPTPIVRTDSDHQPPRLRPSTTDVREIVVASDAPKLAVRMESGNPRIQIVMFYEPMRADTSPPATVSPGL